MLTQHGSRRAPAVLRAGAADPEPYARASRVLHRESNPGNARALVQRHGDRELWVNPPPIPLTTPEMDGVYELPYARAPASRLRRRENPGLGDDPLLGHDHARLLRRLHVLLDHRARGPHHPEPLGGIGPAARSRKSATRRRASPASSPTSAARPPTCTAWPARTRTSRPPAAACPASIPSICPNLNTEPRRADQLYRKARELPGIKKVHVASGVRYDLAVKSPAYVKELVTHHVGGYLKIAPEHTEDGPLSKMMKPGIGAYERFKQLFDKAAKEAGKE